MKYKEDIIQRFWDYIKIKFPNFKYHFESSTSKNKRPPVLFKESEWLNVIMDPKSTQQDILALLDFIPKYERHRWYRSFTSSQVLAQSILGNLKLHKKLNVLNLIMDDEFNQPLLNNINVSSADFIFEYKVNYLGEPKQTSIDAYLNDNDRCKIAIECKFMEEDFENCSRPKLTKKY